jgi:Sec-independent protein translocase protein TatA
MITGGGGSALTLAGMTETLNGVENELKLKWENEQKERKISDLQRQLANSKKSLSQAKEKKDEYRKKLGESSSNYCREK